MHYTKLLIPFAVVIFVISTSTDVQAGPTVNDKAHGFTLNLPDGFQAIDCAAPMPNIIHAFVNQYLVPTLCVGMRFGRSAASWSFSA
jgi:hypothetical protein